MQHELQTRTKSGLWAAALQNKIVILGLYIVQTGNLPVFKFGTNRNQDWKYKAGAEQTGRNREGVKRIRKKADLFNSGLKWNGRNSGLMKKLGQNRNHTFFFKYIQMVALINNYWLQVDIATRVFYLPGITCLYFPYWCFFFFFLCYVMKKKKSFMDKKKITKVFLPANYQSRSYLIFGSPHQ